MTILERVATPEAQRAKSRVDAMRALLSQAKAKEASTNAACAKFGTQMVKTAEHDLGIAERAYNELTKDPAMELAHDRWLDAQSRVWRAESLH